MYIYLIICLLVEYCPTFSGCITEIQKNQPTWKMQLSLTCTSTLYNFALRITLVRSKYQPFSQ